MPVKTNVRLDKPSQHWHASRITALIGNVTKSPAAATVAVAVAPGIATLFKNAVIVT